MQIECAHCGKTISRLFFHNGKCYGSTCIKRLYGKRVVDQASWISLEELADLALSLGFAYEIEKVSGGPATWRGRRLWVGKESISFFLTTKTKPQTEWRNDTRPEYEEVWKTSTLDAQKFLEKVSNPQVTS